MTENEIITYSPQRVQLPLRPQQLNDTISKKKISNDHVDASETKSSKWSFSGLFKKRNKKKAFKNNGIDNSYYDSCSSQENINSPKKKIKKKKSFRSKNNKSPAGSSDFQSPVRSRSVAESPCDDEFNYFVPSSPSSRFVPPVPYNNTSNSYIKYGDYDMNSQFLQYPKFETNYAPTDNTYAIIQKNNKNSRDPIIDNISDSNGFKNVEKPYYHINPNDYPSYINGYYQETLRSKSPTAYSSTYESLKNSQTNIGDYNGSNKQLNKINSNSNLNAKYNENSMGTYQGAVISNKIATNGNFPDGGLNHPFLRNKIFTGSLDSYTKKRYRKRAEQRRYNLTSSNASSSEEDGENSSPNDAAICKSDNDSITSRKARSRTRKKLTREDEQILNVEAAQRLIAIDNQNDNLRILHRNISAINGSISPLPVNRILYNKSVMSPPHKSWSYDNNINITNSIISKSSPPMSPKLIKRSPQPRQRRMFQDKIPFIREGTPMLRSSYDDINTFLRPMSYSFEMQRNVKQRFINQMNKQQNTPQATPINRASINSYYPNQIPNKLLYPTSKQLIHDQNDGGRYQKDFSNIYNHNNIFYHERANSFNHIQPSSTPVSFDGVFPNQPTNNYHQSFKPIRNSFINQYYSDSQINNFNNSDIMNNHHQISNANLKENNVANGYSSMINGKYNIYENLIEVQKNGVATKVPPMPPLRSSSRQNSLNNIDTPDYFQQSKNKIVRSSPNKLISSRKNSDGSNYKPRQDSPSPVLLRKQPPNIASKLYYNGELPNLKKIANSQNLIKNENKKIKNSFLESDNKTSGNSHFKIEDHEEEERILSPTKFKHFEEALNELEEICLQLETDKELLDRAEIRDMTIFNRQYDERQNSRITSPLSLDIEDEPDIVTDDMAFRKMQKQNTSNSTSSLTNGNSKNLPQVSYLLLSPVEFLAEESVSPRTISPYDGTIEPDITLDDVVYRNQKHFKNSLKVLDPQPLFGIPLGPISPAPITDYLHVKVETKQRPRFLPRKNPDIVNDDLAVRKWRKDDAIDPLLQDIPSPNSIKIDIKPTQLRPQGILKKKPATRSMSANLSEIKRGRIYKDLLKYCDVSDEEEATFKSEWRKSNIMLSDPELGSNKWLDNSIYEFNNDHKQFKDKKLGSKYYNDEKNSDDRKSFDTKNKELESLLMHLAKETENDNECKNQNVFNFDTQHETQLVKVKEFDLDTKEVKSDQNEVILVKIDDKNEDRIEHAQDNCKDIDDNNLILDISKVQITEEEISEKNIDDDGNDEDKYKEVSNAKVENISDGNKLVLGDKYNADLNQVSEHALLCEKLLKSVIESTELIRKDNENQIKNI